MSQAPYIPTEAEARRLNKFVREREGGDASAAGDDSPTFQPGRAVRQFRVLRVEADAVICRMISPTSGDLLQTEVAVAKPWHLRQNALDGATKTYADGRAFSWSYSSDRERTATRTSDGETNDEVVTPDYIPGDQNGGDDQGEIITAIRLDTGLTDGDDRRIKWQDLNDAGRFWATKSE